MVFSMHAASFFIVHVAASTPVFVKRVVDSVSPVVKSDGVGVRRHQDDEVGVRRAAKVGPTGQVVKESFTLNHDPVRRAVKDASIADQTSSLCTDTADWKNGHGRDCAMYASAGWCLNHRINKAVDFWGGSYYNFPEHNCCACGKGCSEGVRKAFNSVLCREASFEDCTFMTLQNATQSWSQSELEEAIRRSYSGLGSSCAEGIPVCDGCEGRTNECYAACKNSKGEFAPGLCSKCDAVSGDIKGACCMKGRADDPPECHAVPDYYFKFGAYHECVLVDRPYPKCTGCTQGEFNPLECWHQCGGSDTSSGAGYCSICDAAPDSNGRAIRGACCKKGEPNDPIECQYAPEDHFHYDLGHSCVLTEVPQCLGCGAREGECWDTCNGQRGYCSACDSVGGTPGACCVHSNGQSGPDVGDPEECRVPAGAFLYKKGYHECIVTGLHRTPHPTTGSPTGSPTHAPDFDVELHSSGKVCETSSYITMPLSSDGKPVQNQACNGWNMTHLSFADGEAQCWEHCLANTIAPGCESVQTAPCIASEYWTAYQWCHLHSSCDHPFSSQPGVNTRRIVTLAPTLAPPPSQAPATPAPTREPAQPVSSTVEVHTASTAKPQKVTCSGSVTSDAHCVAWYKAEPEPVWQCELFPDRSAAEVKFSGIEATTAAAVLHNKGQELKYYGVIPFWDWNTLQAICTTGLNQLAPQGR